MKSVIVFYYPIGYGQTEAVCAKNKETIRENLEEMRSRPIADDFHIVVIEDPNIEFVHTEVFFKPE